jgi:hypothetical protein
MEVVLMSLQGLLKAVAWIATFVGVGLIAAVLWHLRRGGTMEELGLRMGTVAVLQFCLVTFWFVGGLLGLSGNVKTLHPTRPQTFLESQMRQEVEEAGRRPLGPIAYAFVGSVILIAVSVAVLIRW